MTDGSLMAAMRTTLESEDFSLRQNRLIWRAMCAIYDSGRLVDRVMIILELQARKEYDSAGGIAYLTALDDGMPVMPSLDGYIGHLKNAATLRRLTLLADNIQKRSQSGLETGDEICQSLMKSIAEVSVNGNGGHSVSTKELIDRVGTDALLRPISKEGLKLPWHRLNAALSGVHAGQMIVVAAYTGCGKTSLALQIATHVTRQGKAALFWTMEMTPAKLFRRLVNQITYTAGSGDPPLFSQRNHEREAAAWLYENPIYFDAHSRTVAGFCGSLRQVSSKTRLGLVVIDYLQLIRASGRVESRTRDVGENSRSIKLAAMDFGLPFLVLSQFSRPGNDAKSPSIHSLKESGDIENDADVILLLNLAERDTTVNEIAASVFLGKHREGPAGFHIPFKFRPHSQSFHALEEE